MTFAGELNQVLGEVESEAGDREQSIDAIIVEAKRTHAQNGKIIFIGNGGSAAIASHMACDWTKNGGYRALAFNDSAALTCLSNDLGYAATFAFQVIRFMDPIDVLVAVSSSGASPNILGAAEAARKKGAVVITLSGFREDNPLRKLGTLNVHVPNMDYGVVECAHLVVLHAALNGARQ